MTDLAEILETFVLRDRLFVSFDEGILLTAKCHIEAFHGVPSIPAEHVNENVPNDLDLSVFLLPTTKLPEEGQMQGDDKGQIREHLMGPLFGPA